MIYTSNNCSHKILNKTLLGTTWSNLVFASPFSTHKLKCHIVVFEAFCRMASALWIGMATEKCSVKNNLRKFCSLYHYLECKKKWNVKFGGHHRKWPITYKLMWPHFKYEKNTVEGAISPTLVLASLFAWFFSLFALLYIMDIIVHVSTLTNI